MRIVIVKNCSSFKFRTWHLKIMSYKISEDYKIINL